MHYVLLIILEPVAIEQIQNITVEEGRNAAKERKVTAGTPPSTVFWKNVYTGEVRCGRLFNISDIRRNQRE